MKQTKVLTMLTALIMVGVIGSTDVMAKSYGGGGGGSRSFSSGSRSSFGGGGSNSSSRNNSFSFSKPTVSKPVEQPKPVQQTQQVKPDANSNKMRFGAGLAAGTVAGSVIAAPTETQTTSQAPTQTPTQSNRPITGTVNPAERTATLKQVSREQQQATTVLPKDNVVQFPSGKSQPTYNRPAYQPRRASDRLGNYQEADRRRVESSPWYNGDRQYRRSNFDDNFQSNGMNPMLLYMLAADNPQAAAYMMMGQGNWLSGLMMLQFADEHDETGALRKEIEKLQAEKQAGTFNPANAPKVANAELITQVPDTAATATDVVVPAPVVAAEPVVKNDEADKESSFDAGTVAVLLACTLVGIGFWAVFLRRRPV